MTPVFSRDLIQPVHTFPELLDAVRAQPDPTRPAITFYRGTERGTSLDYGAYLAAIDAWAAYLQGEGVVPGDRVATLMRNRIEVPVFYLAAMSIGAVVVPLNPAYSVAEMEYVLGDANPVLVLTDRETGLERGDELRRGRRVRLLEDVAPEGVAPAPGGAPRPVAVNGDNPAIILYTSGTTAFPKGVVQMHRNLVANAWSMVKALGIDHPVQYSVMPFYHAHAVGFGMMTCLLSSGHLVMTDRMDPFSWAGVVAGERVTVTSMVPSMLQLLLRTRVTRAAVPDLKWIFVSAAPLPSALAREFEEQSGLRLAHAWGLSEYTNFATILPATDPDPVRSAMMFDRDTPCVGYPLDGARVSVVRPDGTEADPGELGELRITGPSLSLGYHRKPDETAKAFRDGWLHSGDEGYYLAEGGRKYFFVTDRIKDLIIRSGDKVSPTAVESAILAELPELAGRVVAVGYPHQTYGEEVGLVVDTEDMAGVQDRLMKTVQDLPVRNRPKVVLWGQDVIPRTHTGKTQRRMLVPHFAAYRDRSAAGTVAPLDPAARP
ncbi:class I adenylate-forming enzyme family protein [Kitasatospora phosalacinea]|uniref:Long-chain-fatty-acid--CoA ligase n=1 Tax=Kitasatospora phosalacinea TaxID=2065 RepID=A0A9W6PBD5_9ACTN|nr:class I adenylate-forming enzyme family protein [Kitasatospora phosalacinea]GLW52015.1 long-chain-fatty-acid--CoA ligase [Kitasatospora phosalacinea]